MARRRRIALVILAILGVWLLLTLIAFGLFNLGESEPGDGRGEQVTIRR